MNTSYDENVLQSYVDDLYNRAQLITFTYGVIGLAVGFIPAALYEWVKLRDLAFGTVLASIVGTMIGVYIGQNKSWSLRLEAQRTLLQMQIERNTRWMASWCAANPPPAAGR